jgi:UDP-N-acetylglucosamine 2-epimerase
MPAADIALCYGTRPQIIKAARLREALAPLGRVLAIDTGQHYDYTLHRLLYEELGVPPADLTLEVGSGSHAEQLALALTRLEAALREHRPGLAVVIGDTNSTLAAAIAATRLRIPVVHVEAGLRARDALMAEELNRRMVDAIAALLCTPCARATTRLAFERPEARVVETGDVMYDVLLRVRDRLPAPAPGLGLERPWIVATLHRAELTDHPALLGGVLRALDALPLPVLLPLHPRTRRVAAEHGLLPARPAALRIVEPVGHLEALALVRDAEVVVTDSGGVQREAYWLGVPCVTLRGETEWTETLDAGANRLVNPSTAFECLGEVVEERRERRRRGFGWEPTAYGTGDAAERVARAIGGS